MATTIDVKYDFTPYDCTPGKPWDDFDARLMNAASRADDRGWSFADHLNGVDEGGPLGPALPAAPAQLQKAQAALRKRAKESYGLLTKHVLHGGHLRHMKASHFQDGRNSYLYLRGTCQSAVDQLQLYDMDTEWTSIDLLSDIGVNENSMSELALLIRDTNERRPVASQKSLRVHPQRHRPFTVCTHAHLLTIL